MRRISKFRSFISILLVLTMLLGVPSTVYAQGNSNGPLSGITSVPEVDRHFDGVQLGGVLQNVDLSTATLPTNPRTRIVAQATTNAYVVNNTLSTANPYDLILFTNPETRTLYANFTSVNPDYWVQLCEVINGNVYTTGIEAPAGQRFSIEGVYAGDWCWYIYPAGSSMGQAYQLQVAGVSSEDTIVSQSDDLQQTFTMRDGSIYFNGTYHGDLDYSYIYNQEWFNPYGYHKREISVSGVPLVPVGAGTFSQHMLGGTTTYLDNCLVFYIGDLSGPTGNLRTIYDVFPSPTAGGGRDLRTYGTPRAFRPDDIYPSSGGRTYHYLVYEVTNAKMVAFYSNLNYMYTDQINWYTASLQVDGQELYWQY